MLLSEDILCIHAHYGILSWGLALFRLSCPGDHLLLPKCHLIGTVSARWEFQPMAILPSLFNPFPI